MLKGEVQDAHPITQEQLSWVVSEIGDLNHEIRDSIVYNLLSYTCKLRNGENVNHKLIFHRQYI